MGKARITYVTITKEWEDSFMIDIDNKGEELYLKSEYNYIEAIKDYLKKHKDEDDLYMYTPEHDIISNTSEDLISKDSVIMSTEQFMEVSNAIYFSITKDNAKCIASSKVSPAKEYVISEWSNEDMVKDYIANVMSIVLPENVIIPTISFNDDI